MKHFVLFYEFVADFREKRAAHRGVHLAHADAAAERGELVLAGAFADEPAMGMLLFWAETPAGAEDFARTDPYVLNGLVTSWRVREWVTVAGPEALTRVA